MPALANRRQYALTETADGRWVAQDVLAGGFRGMVDVFELPTNGGQPKALLHGEVSFAVPSDPPTGTLDLGEIVLQPVQ